MNKINLIDTYNASTNPISEKGKTKMIQMHKNMHEFLTNKGIENDLINLDKAPKKAEKGKDEIEKELKAAIILVEKDSKLSAEDKKKAIELLKNPKDDKKSDDKFVPIQAIVGNHHFITNDDKEIPFKFAITVDPIRKKENGAPQVLMHLEMANNQFITVLPKTNPHLHFLLENFNPTVVEITLPQKTNA